MSKEYLQTCRKHDTKRYEDKICKPVSDGFPITNKQVLCEDYR